jgi:hypothetical protein
MATKEAPKRKTAIKPDVMAIARELSLLVLNLSFTGGSSSD